MADLNDTQKTAFLRLWNGYAKKLNDASERGNDDDIFSALACMAALEQAAAILGFKFLHDDENRATEIAEI